MQLPLADGFLILSRKERAIIDIIPIGSKQIAYVQYDDQSAHMIVHYHTGHTLAINDVHQDEYLIIKSATNRYDYLVKLAVLHTGGKAIPQSADGLPKVFPKKGMYE